MRPDDPTELPPGQYYLVEHCKDDLWTCAIARNRVDGRMEIVSVVVAKDLIDARLQAFAEIEQLPPFARAP